MKLTHQFFHYVFLNIFGLLGTSCYILADTFFISRAAGSDGITLLNLCLPLYNLIFAVGSMLGLGSATRFADPACAGGCACPPLFLQCAAVGVDVQHPLYAGRSLLPGCAAAMDGRRCADRGTGRELCPDFLLFTPFFMCNYITSSFVRNDGDPSLAMAATLSGSLFNVVFDYLFIFPMGMGLAGAALATAVSPIVSMLVCSLHFLKKSNHIQLRFQRPSVRLLGQSCPLGVSGFVGEMSSGVTTTVFNFLLLRLAGNVGVAAYGVVANYALVATAVFNGVAQGVQPLASACYGQGRSKDARRLLGLGTATALGLAALLYAGVFGFTDTLVALFNQDGNMQMAQYALRGMRVYFIGYLFAGVNIVATGYLGAINRPAEATAASLCRGVVAIVGCSLLLGNLFGMNGVWAAFPAAEALTAVLTACLLRRVVRRTEE